MISNMFNIFYAPLLHQSNEDKMSASLYIYKKGFILRMRRTTSHLLNLVLAHFINVSGNNRLKVCRQEFSTLSKETLLSLASFYCNYDLLLLCNGQFESILLFDPPQAKHLAGGLYDIIPKNMTLQIKNDNLKHHLLT